MFIVFTMYQMMIAISAWYTAIQFVAPKIVKNLGILFINAPRKRQVKRGERHFMSSMESEEV